MHAVYLTRVRQGTKRWSRQRLEQTGDRHPDTQVQGDNVRCMGRTHRRSRGRGEPLAGALLSPSSSLRISNMPSSSLLLCSVLKCPSPGLEIAAPSHTPNHLLKQAYSPFLTYGSPVMLLLGMWSSLRNLPLFKSLCLIFTDFFFFGLTPSLCAISTKLLQHFKPFLSEQMSGEGREVSLGRRLKGVQGFPWARSEHGAVQETSKCKATRVRWRRDPTKLPMGNEGLSPLSQSLWL